MDHQGLNAQLKLARVTLANDGQSGKLTYCTFVGHDGCPGVAVFQGSKVVPVRVAAKVDIADLPSPAFAGWDDAVQHHAIA